MCVCACVCRTAEAKAKLSEEALRKRKVLRAAAGEVWEDVSLAEWPESESLFSILSFSQSIGVCAFICMCALVCIRVCSCVCVHLCMCSVVYVYVLRKYACEHESMESTYAQVYVCVLLDVYVARI